MRIKKFSRIYAKINFNTSSQMRYVLDTLGKLFFLHSLNVTLLYKKGLETKTSRAKLVSISYPCGEFCPTTQLLIRPYTPHLKCHSVFTLAFGDNPL